MAQYLASSTLDELHSIPTMYFSVLYWLYLQIEVSSDCRLGVGTLAKFGQKKNGERGKQETRCISLPEQK